MGLHISAPARQETSKKGAEKEKEKEKKDQRKSKQGRSIKEVNKEEKKQ